MKNQYPAARELRLDLDFFQSDNMKIVKCRFGAIGMLAVPVIMSEILSEGYFVHLTIQLKYRIIDAVPGLTIEELEKLLKLMAEIGMIDPEIFREHEVITSEALQTSYFKQRKMRPGVEYPYVLIDDTRGTDPHTAPPSPTAIAREARKPEIQSLRPTKQILSEFYIHHKSRGWIDRSGQAVTSWPDALKDWVRDY